jgi:hypothetical protein
MTPMRKGVHGREGTEKEARGLSREGEIGKGAGYETTEA